MIRIKILFQLVLIVGIVYLMPAASDAQLNFADNEPIVLGSYWTYQEASNPLDTYTYSVFECLTFSGNPACKAGTDANNYGIIYNDGTTFTYYANVEGGVLNDFTDVSIGEFTDGHFFNLATPTNFKLLRVWDNLDSTTKNIYGIDPTLNNLIMEATYDSNYTANSHNSIVEANLALSLPDYSVTAISWFAPNVGEIVDLHIDAQTGNVGNRYELVDYNIAPEPGSSTLFLVGAATLGFRRFRKKRS